MVWVFARRLRYQKEFLFKCFHEGFEPIKFQRKIRHDTYGLIKVLSQEKEKYKETSKRTY